jgi:hypothetical protein
MTADPLDGPRAWADRFTELLVAYRLLVTAAVVVAGLALYFTDASLPAVEIGTRLKVIVFAGLGGAVLVWVPGSRLVKWLYSPDWRYLLEIDARDTEIALYKLSPQAFGRLSVVEGELFQLDGEQPVYECRQFDPEQLRAVGTWRGSASDLELIEERERIDEIRRTLEDEAQKGLSIRMKVGSIVRTAVNSITRDMLAEVEGATIYQGSQVEDTVRAAMEEYDVREEFEQADARDGENGKFRFGEDRAPDPGPEDENGSAPETEEATP